MNRNSGVALKAIVEHRLSHSILQTLDRVVRRFNSTASLQSFRIKSSALKQADVTIITSTLLNLTQITIDAVVPRHSQQ
jgi:hypothetical protein